MLHRRISGINELKNLQLNMLLSLENNYPEHLISPINFMKRNYL